MIKGVTLVPERLIPYIKDRGIDNYELVPMLKREGRDRGVIISDSVELLEHISFGLPHLATEEHIAVLRVKIDEASVVVESSIRDTETEKLIYLWVVDRIEPSGIEGPEGILFSPPGYTDG